MYGRGTGDNKGQHLAQLLALRALNETGTGALPCRVTFVLDGEEEIGSPNLAAAVVAGSAGSRPDLAVWSDGPVHESGRATVVLGVRGVVAFQLRATGAVSPLHSGNWGGVAPNPAWRLVHLLASMRSADGRVLIDGAHAGVEPLSPGEQAALDALPADVDQVLRRDRRGRHGTARGSRLLRSAEPAHVHDQLAHLRGRRRPSDGHPERGSGEV